MDAILKINENINELAEKIDGITQTVNYLENQSRRNNLCIEGLPEQPGETWTDTELKVGELLITKLQLHGDNIEIERALRNGKTSGSREKPRAVNVKF